MYSPGFTPDKEMVEYTVIIVKVMLSHGVDYGDQPSKTALSFPRRSEHSIQTQQTVEKLSPSVR